MSGGVEECMCDCGGMRGEKGFSLFRFHPTRLFFGI
jgi:hypothetical protein